MHNFNRKCFGNEYWWLRPRDNFQIKHRKDLLEKRNCNNDVYSNLVQPLRLLSNTSHVNSYLRRIVMVLSGQLLTCCLNRTLTHHTSYHWNERQRLQSMFISYQHCMIHPRTFHIRFPPQLHRRFQYYFGMFWLSLASRW